MCLSKIINTIIVIFIISQLVNCTLLGVSKIELNNTLILNPNYTTKIEGLTLNSEWLGNAYPVPTAYNFLGRITRFVIPYTDKTTLIRLTIENNSDFLVFLDREKIKLKIEPDGLELRPLSLDYFKKQWPTFAVKDSNTMLDHSVAISHIIRTIFTSFNLLPKKKYEGILPFEKIPDRTYKASLIIEGIEINNELKDIIIDFSKN